MKNILKLIDKYTDDRELTPYIVPLLIAFMFISLFVSLANDIYLQKSLTEEDYCNTYRTTRALPTYCLKYYVRQDR